MRALLLVVVAACGAPAAAVSDCVTEYVEVAGDVDCDLLRSRAALSRTFLVHAAVTSGAELDQLRAHTSIVVKRTEPGEVCGHYVPGGIELCTQTEMLSLLHEELHMLEVAHLTWQPNHGGWKARGWFQLEDEYWFDALLEDSRRK